jgi:hypothetical protein
MRYGSVLQRRLVQLESVIKIRNPAEEWSAIRAEALSRLSVEDLKILRDIVEKQTAGIAVEETPLNQEVVARCNATCDEARKNHTSFRTNPKPGRQDSFR